MDSINDLEKLMFKSSSGQLIPFGEVAKIRIDSGVSQIRHNDGQVYLTLGASNAPDANLNQIVRTFQTQVKDIPLPSGVEVSYGGEFDMMGDTFSDMGRNMIFALLLVYILLSVQFNSMTQPLVIIISVPLALIGTFIGLAVTGNNLGFYSLFGIVSLVGIAVNDAIVLVDYTNYLRKEGFKRNDALVEAVKTRFNPVFATSITTIGGVLPISVADPALGQLGYALIFGLMASTVLTLLIIPIAYSVSDGVTTSIRDRFGIFAEETEEIISEA
jgi:HAE1 family hydrophobic/amphiphilic exporter-1